MNAVNTMVSALLVLGVACAGDKDAPDTDGLTDTDGPTDTDTDTDTDTTETADTGTTAPPVELDCEGDTEIGFERVDVPYTSDFYGYGYSYGTQYGTYGGGWNGIVFDTRPEWQAFAQQAGFTDPIPSVDFDTNDVVLYHWIYGGCDEEVLFLGACSDGTTRRAVVACNPGPGDFCDALFPRAEILVVAEDADTDLIVTFSCDSD